MALENEHQHQHHRHHHKQQQQQLLKPIKVNRCVKVQRTANMCSRLGQESKYKQTQTKKRVLTLFLANNLKRMKCAI